MRFVLTQKAEVEQELDSYSWRCHLLFVLLEKSVVTIVEHYAPSHASKVRKYRQQLHHCWTDGLVFFCYSEKKTYN